MTDTSRKILQRNGVLIVIVFFMLTLGIAVCMTLKNSSDLRSMLESSVKSQVISTSIAASEIIDVDKFASYDSLEDVKKDSEAFWNTMRRLRQLQKDTKSKYIYVVKRFSDDKYYFIFDTDFENTTIEETVIEYKLEPVHRQALLGKESADLNMSDEYGRYHTGAVPIRKDSSVIGFVSTDLDNTLWDQSNNVSRANALYLIASAALAMCVTLLVIALLLRRLQNMQDKLFHLANYDTVITGLPNRQYLMRYLKEASTSIHGQTPFALLFIDLDDFKQVNDKAGHDAGDAVLRHVAEYLKSVHKNSKAFRPVAGAVNVSARVGGDEFIQVFPGVGTEAEAAVIAQKILDNFSSQALDKYIEKYHIGLSIGVALFPLHSENYHVLIKYADIAMYSAKQAGKNTYRIYNDDLRQKLNESGYLR